jgi:hypothetical protein
MSNTTTKPYAGYIRVSRKGDRDEDRLRSPDFQRQLIERQAEAQGLTLMMFQPEIAGGRGGGHAVRLRLSRKRLVGSRRCVFTCVSRCLTSSLLCQEWGL